MKEFDKWLKEDSIKTGYLYDDVAEKQREKGWRAALKWVKSRSQVGKSLYMIDVNDIDEELEHD